MIDYTPLVSITDPSVEHPDYVAVAPILSHDHALDKNDIVSLLVDSGIVATNSSGIYIASAEGGHRLYAARMSLSVLGDSFDVSEYPILTDPVQYQLDLYDVSSKFHESILSLSEDHMIQREKHFQMSYADDLWQLVGRKSFTLEDGSAYCKVIHTTKDLTECLSLLADRASQYLHSLTYWRKMTSMEKWDAVLSQVKKQVCIFNLSAFEYPDKEFPDSVISKAGCIINVRIFIYIYCFTNIMDHVPDHIHLNKLLQTLFVKFQTPRKKVFALIYEWFKSILSFCHESDLSIITFTRDTDPANNSNWGQKLKVMVKFLHIFDDWVQWINTSSTQFDGNKNDASILTQVMKVYLSRVNVDRICRGGNSRRFAMVQSRIQFFNDDDIRTLCLHGSDSLSDLDVISYRDEWELLSQIYPTQDAAVPDVNDSTRQSSQVRINEGLTYPTTTTTEDIEYTQEENDDEGSLVITKQHQDNEAKDNLHVAQRQSTRNKRRPEELYVSEASSVMERRKKTTKKHRKLPLNANVANAEDEDEMEDLQEEGFAVQDIYWCNKPELFINWKVTCITDAVSFQSWIENSVSTSNHGESMPFMKLEDIIEGMGSPGISIEAVMKGEALFSVIATTSHLLDLSELHNELVTSSYRTVDIEHDDPFNARKILYESTGNSSHQIETLWKHYSQVMKDLLSETEYLYADSSILFDYGGERKNQKAHYDFDIKKMGNGLPLASILAVEDFTILLFTRGEQSKLNTVPIRLVVKAGTMLIFRGDLVHAGDCQLQQFNTRIHSFLVPKSPQDISYYQFDEVYPVVPDYLLNRPMDLCIPSFYPNVEDDLKFLHGVLMDAPIVGWSSLKNDFSLLEKVVIQMICVEAFIAHYCDLQKQDVAWAMSIWSCLNQTMKIAVDKIDM
jgi:hypothetical protein